MRRNKGIASCIATNGLAAARRVRATSRRIASKVAEVLHEPPRGLEIDGKLELDRRFHRQICGLGALQDAIDI